MSDSEASKVLDMLDRLLARPQPATNWQIAGILFYAVFAGVLAVFAVLAFVY